MANVTLKRWDGTQWVELLPTPASHTHSIADVINLQNNLDGKLNLTGGTLTGLLNATDIKANSIELFSGTSGSGVVLSSPNDIRTWVYSGKNLSVSAQESSPSGIAFSPDGVNLYISGTSGDDINRYILSTPWDISTAVYNSVSVLLPDTAPQGVFLRPDGTRLFFVGSTNDRVYQYTLSTAWDITSSSMTAAGNISVVSQDTAPVDIVFKSDGTKMYIVGSTNDSVYEYSLSTAWDVTSATFTSSLNVSSFDTDPTGLDFSEDGSKMYVVGTIRDHVGRYNLSTPWDISTATFFGETYIGFQEITPQAIWVEDDLDSVFVVGTTSDSIFQYTRSQKGLVIDSDINYIKGQTEFDENVYMSRDLIVRGSGGLTRFEGAVTTNSTINIGSTATFNGSVNITGNANITSTTSTTADASLTLAGGITPNTRSKLVQIGENAVNGTSTQIRIGAQHPSAASNILFQSDPMTATFSSNGLKISRDFNSLAPLRVEGGRSHLVSATGSTILSDTFTEATTTNLENHTSDSNHTWEKVASFGSATTISVIGGQSEMGPLSSAGNSGSVFFSSVIPSSSDYEIVLDIRTLPGSDDTFNVFVKAVDANNMHVVRVSSQQATVYRISGGLVVSTSNINFITNTNFPTANSLLRVRVIKDTLTAWVGNNFILGMQAPTLSGSGKIGIGFGAINASIFPSDETTSTWRIRSITVKEYNDEGINAAHFLNGNVGIGTTTPAEALDVLGNISVSGTVDGVDISSLDSNVVKLSGNQTVGGEKTFTSRIITNDRVVIGDIVGYDVPYIAWGGGSNTYQLSIADYAYENPVIIDTQNAKVTAATFASNVTTGTAPLTVASTTAVTNLNADLLDGNHASAFSLVGHTHTKSDITDFAHTHVIDDVTGLQTALDGKVNTTAVGATNGVASLGADGRIPLAQLPNAVFDSLIFYNTHSSSANVAVFGQIAKSSADAANRSPIGYYWVASAQITLTAGPNQITGGKYYNTRIYPGDNEAAIVNGTTTLEVGDWFILTEFGNQTGTSSDPISVYIAVVNNTYELATTAIDGIVRLSSQTTYASLSGNNVVTDGVLKTVIDNAGFGTSNLALGETSTTAYRGDRGKIAYDHSQITDGTNPHGTTFANIASKPTTLSGYGITDAIDTSSTGQTKAGSLTVNGTLTVPGFDRAVVSTIPANTVYSTDLAQIAQAPFGGVLWHDLWAFNRLATPTFETSNDGTTYTSATLNNNLFAMKENQAITVINAAGGQKSARWTWNGMSWSIGRWLVIGHTYTFPTPNITVLVERSADAVTWTTIHTSTRVAGAAPAWYIVSDYAGDLYVRLTITHNSGSNVAISSIRLLSSRWGDQGRGKEWESPWDWDGSRNISTPGNITGNVLRAWNGATTTFPAFSFNTDTNTGIYSPAEDTIGFVEGGVESMRLDSSGRLGLGTTSPLNKLDVRITGGDSSDGIMVTRDDTTTVANEILGGIGFDSTDGNVPSSILEASAYIAAFAAEDHSVGDKGGYLTFGTAPIDQDDDTVSIERMRITSEGGVGIGTNNPTHKLHVVGESLFTNGNTFFRKGSTGDMLFLGSAELASVNEIGLYENGGDRPLVVYNPDNDTMFYGGTDMLYLNLANKKIGVGTTTPSAKFEVKSDSTTVIPLIVDTLASHTVNLAEFKLNGTTKLVVTKDGKLQAGSGDGEIHVTSQGVRIETLADNNFVPLTVNKDDTNTSARLQQWQFSTDNVAYIDETGEFYAPALVSISGANYGSLGMTSGPFFSRNINDATTTLTVNNANASSTGNLLDLQAAGTNIISFKKDGTLLAPATFTIDPSGHGDITGKVIILGDLQVDGTTTTINSTTIDVADKNILLSKGATNKAASDGAGITIDLGTDGTASLLYGSTADIFSLNKGLSVGGQLSVSSPNYPPLSTERTSTATNTSAGSMRFLHTTTADMVDGFGVSSGYWVKDSANVLNELGGLGANRSGADNSGRLYFYTANGGSITEKMTIMPNGNVGINTINPDERLHLNAGSLLITNGLIKMQQSGGTKNDSAEIRTFGADGFKIFSGRAVTTGTHQPITFATGDNYTSGATRMTITSAGSVGIGTTAPVALLNVNAAGRAAVIGGVPAGAPNSTVTSGVTSYLEIVAGTAGGATNGSALVFHNPSISTASLEYKNSDANLGYFNFRSDDTDWRVGIGTVTPSERLHVVGKTYLSGGAAAWNESTPGQTRGTLHLGEASSTSHFGSAITFGARDSSSGTVAQAGIYTRTDGTYGTKMYLATTSSYATGSQTRLMIDHVGNVGIGTVAPGDRLEVSGTIKASALKINDTHFQDTATVTTTSTTQTVLATYAVATYATGKFLIQATSGGNRHISELLVTHNGTVSTATEYAILKTSGNLFTVTTDISGGNVRILVTSASATSTVYRTTFTLIGV